MHPVPTLDYDSATPNGVAAEPPNLTLAPVPALKPEQAAATTHAPRPVQRLTAWLHGILPGMLMAAISLSLFVAFWYFATKYRWDFYIRFTNIPSPGEVLANVTQLMHSDRFYSNMWISLRRILLGFGIATGFGVAFGLLIGQYRIMRGLLLPVFEVLRPIPAIAWVPMSIMLWPSNETSIVFITFLGSFFPILLNTIHGVNSVDPVLLRAGRCLGAKEPALLRQVILPAALPHIFTGLAIGMGVAWVSLIAAEMISGQFGVGYFTWEAYSLIQYSDIAIGMIVIGVLGLACSGGIRLLGNLLMPWLPAHANGGRK
ncbi:MAG: ABC transporter permease [Thiobacillus sp.]